MTATTVTTTAPQHTFDELADLAMAVIMPFRKEITDAAARVADAECSFTTYLGGQNDSDILEDRCAARGAYTDLWRGEIFRAMETAFSDTSIPCTQGDTAGSAFFSFGLAEDREYAPCEMGADTGQFDVTSRTSDDFWATAPRVIEAISNAAEFQENARRMEARPTKAAPGRV